MSAGGGPAKLLVWSQGEVWRWTYEEASSNGAGPFRLDSAIAFPDAAQARSAAAVAFPGVGIETVPAEVPARGGPDRGGPRPGRRQDITVDVVLAAFLGVAVFVAYDRGSLAAAWYGWVRRQIHGVVQRWP